MDRKHEPRTQETVNITLFSPTGGKLFQNVIRDSILIRDEGYLQTISFDQKQGNQRIATNSNLPYLMQTVTTTIQG